MNLTECNEIWDNKLNSYKNKVQTQLDSTMPWIGMYIAAASAACTLAMTADAFSGFRSKRYWLPSKYFSLNAFSLTVLAVTMKLPVDLTSSTLGRQDKLARITSLVLMTTAMANCMISLGSMENNEIILNIAALGLLVVTISGNVFIHMAQIHRFPDVRSVLVEEVVSPVLMLLLLANLCCLAVMIPSAKKYVESKYDEMHKTVSNKKIEWGNFTTNELRIVVKNYWVMAATGSPQFVIARSVISGTSALMCLLMAMTLVEAHVRLRFIYIEYEVASNYKWSIKWILWIQSIGVVLGTTAPLLRWFIASWFKMSEIGRKSLRDEFKIEKYWTSRLVEWRDISLPLQIQHRKFRKLLNDAKILLLNIFIGVQIFLVSVGKLVLLISAKYGNAVYLCFNLIKDFKRPDSRASSITRGSKSRDGTELDFSNYVLLLEGEAQLPNKILKNICNEVDKLIQIGENKQPKNLIRLLRNSTNFNGVGQFDSNEVPSLHSQEPPNCWSLPVVTLTSISIALTNIVADKSNQLLVGVSEGLSLVKLIEKTLNRNGELENIRKVADVVWVEVELYTKWEDTDLHSTSVRGKTNKDTLQNLSNAAEKIVTDFMTQTKDILMQNPLNWPVRVIAANSMYRITQTILIANKDDKYQTDDKLFESLSVIISDILAACLTNLVHVITLKCHTNNLKEREESVRRAAILLGESKGILEILQQHELPSLDLERAANIDEWRASMDQDIENHLASVSALRDNATIPQSNEEHSSTEIVG